MSDVEFWLGRRWKQYYPHLRPSIKRQALDCMSDWLHRSTGCTEAALQLRRAAASLGRGVVAHVRYVTL